MRHYYRCNDCLTVSSVDGDQLTGALCGACGGKLEHMGRVHAATLVKGSAQCVCDARCTCAMGPHCDCQCGGENHGIGMAGFVIVDKVVGSVPRVMPRHPDIARMVAAEYRAALADAERRLAAMPGAIAQSGGQRVPYGVYMDFQGARQALWHARGLKVHKTRLAALAKVAGGKIPNAPKREQVQLSLALA